MSELETAIAKGKFAMLDYLEGKQINILGSWYKIENGKVLSITMSMYDVDMLVHFCREAREVQKSEKSL